MNQRFTLDRRSFEHFLAALSVVQQLKKQAAYQRALSDHNQPFFSLLQLQRAINSGTLDLRLVMSNVVTLTKSVLAANSAGVWLFRNADEFSCCAQIGTIQDPDRLGTDILARLGDPNHQDPNSCAFSPTLRKASRYPGCPNSVAIAALRVHEKIVGAVAAFSSDFDAFATRDLDNLQFLASLLEQALQKAMQAGYREAVALEHTALLKLLQKIGPHVHGLNEQLSPSKHAPAFEPVEDSFPAPECAADRRFPQPASSPACFSAPAEISAPDREPSAADLSVPGVGVRAALGDVREFTGDKTSFFLWEAMRRGTARARRFAVQCRTGASALVTASASHLQNVASHLVHTPRIFVGQASGRMLSTVTSFAARTHSGFAQIFRWRLKVRLVGLGHLRPSSWLHFDWPRLRSARSRSQLLAKSFSGKCRTWMNHGKEQFTYLVRLSKVQARSLRREFRQTRANLSAAVARERMQVRIAQRHQKSMLTNSAQVTGEALQQAGESLADVASTTGHSAITAISELRGRMTALKRLRLNPRALWRSAGAIGLLAVMAIFLALQAGMRHSLEHLNAASASSGEAAPVAEPAAVAEAQPKPGPTSHLEITDASVADTLHDMTRYEIITLQRAAEYGDDEAAFQLGMAYETGYYVRRDCSKAAHWVKVAAESGNPAAAYNLGLRYRNGDGLQADESAAEHWLRMASSRQYSPAKLALAAVR